MAEGDVEMAGAEEIAVPVVNEEDVAEGGIVAVVLYGTAGIEGVDAFPGDSQVDEAEAGVAVVGNLEGGFLGDVNLGVMEAHEAGALDGAIDEATEIQEAAVHVGANEGGLVRVKAKDVAGVEDSPCRGGEAGVVAVAGIREVIGGFAGGEVVVEVAALVVKARGDDETSAHGRHEVLPVSRQLNERLVRRGGRTGSGSGEGGDHQAAPAIVEGGEGVAVGGVEGHGSQYFLAIRIPVGEKRSLLARIEVDGKAVIIIHGGKGHEGGTGLEDAPGEVKFVIGQIGNGGCRYLLIRHGDNLVGMAGGEEEGRE